VEEVRILNVHWSDTFGILICLYQTEGFFAELGRSKKVLVYGELCIVLRREVNFDREEKAAAIDCLATAALKINTITGLERP
jgi:hypothetical protein